jgi:hypothetical protein
VRRPIVSVLVLAVAVLAPPCGSASAQTGVAPDIDNRQQANPPPADPGLGTLIQTHPALQLSPPGAAKPAARVKTVPILPRDPPEQAGVRRHSDYPMTRGPGPYVVQVASQRTEEDARASFAALQAKYPAVLGSRQPVVQRVELEGRGVYYRAHVGPFPTAEEAGAICSSLKEAGGQCIVQRHGP